ncbi:MAG: hypothetical protein UY18_C0005G0007 [Microgenomates group bacterium GW2011_GWF2_47_9]|nr:MAG: hypothetical protein UY18_C0005G0007 [Microgenomates group bacterium GW2011_GWF2_47_9]
MARSRLKRIKSKRAGTQAIVYIVLSGLILVAMVTWGIPAAARLAGLMITSDNGVGGVAELSPTPPILSDVPEATNSAHVDVSGFAQPGVEVALVVNGSEHKKILTDDAGVFHFDAIPVQEGENTVHAYAISSRGKESDLSKAYTILVDNEAPEIELDSPKDADVYRGESQRIANFVGKVTEEGTKVYIGDRVVIVQTDGTFSLPYQMIEGDQEVKVRVVDSAGNENEVIIKIRWEP